MYPSIWLLYVSLFFFFFFWGVGEGGLEGEGKSPSVMVVQCHRLRKHYNFDPFFFYRKEEEVAPILALKMRAYIL
jgi:hypothetical protein